MARSQRFSVEGGGRPPAPCYRTLCTGSGRRRLLSIGSLIAERKTLGRRNDPLDHALATRSTLERSLAWRLWGASAEEARAGFPA